MGERGGQPSGDAFLELAFRDVTDGFERIVTHVVAIRAMAVDVEKAGHDRPAAGIDHLIGVRQGLARPEHGGDAIIFQKQRGALDFHIRGHNTGIANQRFHGSNQQKLRAEYSSHLRR